MIDKKEESSVSAESDSLVKACQYLESTTLQAQSAVRSSFTRLRDILQSREKQLLRQIDAAHNQQITVLQTNFKNLESDQIHHLTVDMDAENEIKEAIVNFGTVELKSTSLGIFGEDGTFLQKVKDYHDASQDSESRAVATDEDRSSPTEEAIARLNQVSIPDNFSSSEQKKHSDTPIDKDPNTPSGIVDRKNHTDQVEHWLKQISAETETEPSVGEPKNFSAFNSSFQTS